MPTFVRQRSHDTRVVAVQWFPGQQLPGIADEAASHPGSSSLLPMPPHAFMHTPKGRLTVFAGDWVITEPDGTRHTCYDQLFRQTYVQVEEEPAVAVAAPA